MKSYKIVIPSWLEMNLEMQAETGCLYPAFIQLGGEPLYTHIMRSYDQFKNNVEFVFILADDAPKLSVKKESGFDWKELRISDSKSIADSVSRALVDVHSSQTVVIHMGDTLVTFGFLKEKQDTIFVKNKDDIYRWTSVAKDSNGGIKVLTDRECSLEDKSQSVCVGVFLFSDSVLIRECLQVALILNEPKYDPFFIAIEKYSQKRAVSLNTPPCWYDCGHVDTFYKSRLDFTNLRHFNTLNYDSERGLVTKRSIEVKSFRHQVRWYRQVPDSIASFLPRIYESDDGEDPFLTMELLTIPTLSDLFVNQRLRIGAWNTVAKKISNVLELFKNLSYESLIASDLAEDVYINKTRERLELFCQQSPTLAEHWVVSDAGIISIEYVLKKLNQFAEKTQIFNTRNLTPIHGDLCFSNIMYDIRGASVKLIDPRGSFGVPGIYGDSLYDKAKLLHSYCGGYDLILSDNYEVHTSDAGELNLIVAKSDYHLKVQQIFNRVIFPGQSEYFQCQAIQALLFLSMLPLHRDRIDRQRGMLALGLKLFGEIIKK